MDHVHWELILVMVVGVNFFAYQIGVRFHSLEKRVKKLEESTTNDQTPSDDGSTGTKPKENQLMLALLLQQELRGPTNEVAGDYDPNLGGLWVLAFVGALLLGLAIALYLQYRLDLISGRHPRKTTKR